MRRYRLFSGVLTLGVLGLVEIVAFRVIGQIVKANFFLDVAALLMSVAISPPLALAAAVEIFSSG